MVGYVEGPWKSRSCIRKGLPVLLNCTAMVCGLRTWGKPLIHFRTGVGEDELASTIASGSGRRNTGPNYGALALV